MYKESWGLKRTCPMCRSPYYDLGRKELNCPECGKEIEVTNLAKPRRGRKPGSLNVSTINAKVSEQETKPKEIIEEDLEFENVEVESDDTNIEDDTVLIEEENDIDPKVDVGIKSTEDKEEV